MAELRLAHGWTDEELKDRLARLRRANTNFPWDGPDSQLGQNWRRYYTESVVGRETPGPIVKGGAFEIAKKAISEYQFSDPRIVVGHFDPKDPVHGRTMALEIKVLGLRYLCGVRIGAIKESSDAETTTFGFRYDTLEGHLEIGSEWFVLTKHHATGEVWFRISASWRPGQFPNWWSELGFHVVSRRYQLVWHRLAYLRLRDIVGSKGAHLLPVPRGGDLIHTGPEIANSDIWAIRPST